ncbi:hypothetical protein ACOMHN_057206 [Nucella lapillus]
MTSSSQGADSVGVILTIGLICVVAVVANILVVILTTRKSGSKKSCINMYIVNLAVSDLILAGVTMPLILMDANIPEFTKYDWECKLKMALPLFNIYCSICTMVLMSFDRMWIIVKGKSMSQRKAAISLLVTWTLSLLLTAPQFYEYRLVEKWEEEENEMELDCSSFGRNSKFIQTYAALVLILAYLLPLALMTRNYIYVIVYIVKHAGQVRGQVSRAKLHVLRTVVTITATFLILWLPFFVLFTIEEVTGTDDDSQFSSTPHIIKQVFIALSATSNPIIYFSLMPDYRQALKSLLLPARCCASRTYPVNIFNTDTNQGQEDSLGAQSGRGRGGVVVVSTVSSQCQPAVVDDDNDEDDDGRHCKDDKESQSKSPCFQPRPALAAHK